MIYKYNYHYNYFKLMQTEIDYLEYPRKKIIVYSIANFKLNSESKCIKTMGGTKNDVQLLWELFAKKFLLWSFTQNSPYFSDMTQNSYYL